MGVHKPATNPAQRTAAFALKSDVAIYGGFAGTETALNQRDWTLNVTVLSGDIDNNDTVDASGVVTTANSIVGSNAYHVVSATNVLSTAVVDGFVITGGQANNGAFPHNAGGGDVHSVQQPDVDEYHLQREYSSIRRRHIQQQRQPASDERDLHQE